MRTTLIPLVLLVAACTTRSISNPGGARQSAPRADADLFERKADLEQVDDL